VKQYITPDILAGEIRLARQSYSGVFAVVEGTDDARLYKEFIDPECCVFKVAHSKEKAVETVAKFGRAWGVFAIVDSDEWPLLGKQVPVPHVFFTDCHDAETMIIKSEAFDKFLRHQTDDKRLGEFLQKRGMADLRSVLLIAGKPLGCMRIVSNVGSYRMDFKKLYFEGFVSPGTLEVDIQKMITFIRRNSESTIGVSDDELKKELQKANAQYSDPWLVVSGHDITRILTIGLNHIFGHQRFRSKIDVEDVEVGLRLAFDINHFHGTALYDAIRKWEHECWQGEEFLRN